MASLEAESSTLPNKSRPSASFHPSPWGDYFLDYVPDDEETKARKEKEAKELEDEVKGELLQLVTTAQVDLSSLLKLLGFVDAIERLGVGYRLEREIQQAIHTIHGMKYMDRHQLDLYHTSLRFRLLRQHGFYVTCDVFQRFQDETGLFMESLASDVKAMLALYEASFLGKHGDYIMDEARVFTIAHLKSVAADSSPSLLSPAVAHALHQPLHRGLPRLESRFFISFYEGDNSHNKRLLKFAKLDFNLVQASHKLELKHMTRWWNNLDVIAKMPFKCRDRLVEGFFWIQGLYYQPEYFLGRKIALQMFKVMSIVDDIYDAYGTLDELTVFTKVLERWEKGSMSMLPDYMQLCYKVILDTFEELEHDLAPLGCSKYVKYAQEEMVGMCRVYLLEAKWRDQKHTPTFDEYMNKAAIISFGCNLFTVVSYLGMKDANKETFEWAHQNPLFVRDSAIIGRLMDDMASHGFEQRRNHVPSAVENYMRQHRASEEATLMEFQKQVDYCWKDINEMMMKPHIMHKSLLTIILNECRIADVVYKNGEDNYTFSNHSMKKNISLILADPIPI